MTEALNLFCICMWLMDRLLLTYSNMSYLKFYSTIPTRESALKFASKINQSRV